MTAREDPGNTGIQIVRRIPSNSCSCNSRSDFVVHVCCLLKGGLFCSSKLLWDIPQPPAQVGKLSLYRVIPSSRDDATRQWQIIKRLRDAGFRMTSRDAVVECGEVTPAYRDFPSTRKSHLQNAFPSGILYRLFVI